MTSNQIASKIASIVLLLFMTPVHGQELTDTCRETLTRQGVSVVVAGGPGGGYDTYGRAFAPALSEVLGATIRVINMPGGGGMMATSHVAQSDPDGQIPIMIENLADIVANADETDDDAVAATDLAALGIILTEDRTWLGRKDLDLTDPQLSGLLGSSGSIQAAVIDIGMVARALGLDVRVIAGYDGSSENVAAILRQEVDFTATSSGTSRRSVQSSDLEVALILSDRPSAVFPDAPYLGGPDGMAALRAAALSDEERAERLEAAEAAIRLSIIERAVVTTAALRAETLECLRAAVDVALLSPDFAATAEAQGRGVDPTTSDGAIPALVATIAAWARVRDDLEGMEDSLRP